MNRRCIHQRNEAVCNTFGNVQQFRMLIAETNTRPLQVFRRVFAKIENNVIRRTANAGYRLCFLMGRPLIVHPTQRVFDLIKGNIALPNDLVHARFSEFLTAIRARKETPFID